MRSTPATPSGSISAWTEDPSSRSPRRSRPRVDLRVGGGSRVHACATARDWARSPRGRRIPTTTARRCRRRRSIRASMVANVGCCGSISAWAEDPPRCTCRRCRSRVDLRVGGGSQVAALLRAAEYGRSPRGRRIHARGSRAEAPRRSISAWAEDPGHDRGAGPSRPVDLRVGGGSMEVCECRHCYYGRSPRGRRIPAIGVHDLIDRGSISAWAEDPVSRRATRASARVDLRVGGGSGSFFFAILSSMGRSPRGRRILELRADRRRHLGSISAWAEDPRW